MCTESLLYRRVRRPDGVLLLVTLCYILLFCFFISSKRNSLFVSIHALLCNKKDACADYKDCTDYVEDCGTHTTGFWKIRDLSYLRHSY